PSVGVLRPLPRISSESLGTRHSPPLALTRPSSRVEVFAVGTPAGVPLTCPIVWVEVFGVGNSAGVPPTCPIIWVEVFGAGNSAGVPLTCPIIWVEVFGCPGSAVATAPAAGVRVRGGISAEASASSDSTGPASVDEVPWATTVAAPSTRPSAKALKAESHRVQRTGSPEAGMSSGEITYEVEHCGQAMFTPAAI